MKTKILYTVFSIALSLALVFSFSCTKHIAEINSNESEISQAQSNENEEIKQNPETDVTSPIAQNEEDQENLHTDSAETSDLSGNALNYDDIIKYFIKPLALNEKPELDKGFDFTLDTLDESNLEENFNIYGFYPKIEGPPNSSFEKFNKEIIDFVETTSSDFKAELKKMYESLEGQEDGEPYNFTNELAVSGCPQLCGNKISSVIFLNYYFTGGAHGSTLPVPLNFDMQADRLLELEDIFKKDSDYLEKLAELCKKDLKEQMSDPDALYVESMFEEGTSPEYENYSNFVMLQNDIVIIFSQYQIAPYAAGMFGVRIPYTELSGYLVDNLI